ncbi:MAG TPA: methyltransferase domain-containing protein [Thermodesulfobacteriaceae bacterium]|nr:methyltransferase domain-containing protein [Thermodesulfobacteriaceae bacterium]
METEEPGKGVKQGVRGLVVEIRGSASAADALERNRKWEEKGWVLLNVVRLDYGQTCLRFNIDSPMSRWDQVLGEFSAAVDEVVRGEELDALDWQVVPCDLHEGLNGREPITLGSSWYAAFEEGAGTGQDAFGARRKIILDAGWAFGSGYHPSTRSCVIGMEWLADENGLSGKRVLDIGTGTGILAVLAGKMGASEVAAVDRDPDAVYTATKNVRKNRLERTVTVSQTPVEALAGTQWDIILANLAISVFCCMSEKIVSLLCRDEGILLLGGYRQLQSGRVVRILSGYGLEAIWDTSVDGWEAGVFVNMRRQDMAV